MFFNLLLLFTLVPVIELTLLIKVGSHIGALPTVLIVIGTGIFGAYLARLEGLLLLQRIQTELNQGRMPAESLIDGFIILISGVLLITPGFLTDLLGFAGLIPFCRTLIKRWIKRKIEQAMREGRVITITPFRR